MEKSIHFYENIQLRVVYPAIIYEKAIQWKCASQDGIMKVMLTFKTTRPKMLLKVYDNGADKEMMRIHLLRYLSYYCTSINVNR